MSTGRFGLSTQLFARLLAFPVMAGFAAKVCATRKSFSAELAARNILTPTGDRLYLLLTALAEPFRQVRALGTCAIVRVTIMGDWRMSAGRGPSTGEAATRGLRATGNWWIDGSPSTVTG